MDHVVGLPATPSPSPSSIGNSLLDPKMIFQTTETSGNGINYSDSTTGLSFGGLRPVLPPSTITMSNGHDHDEDIVDPSEMASDLRGRQNSESLSQSSNGEGKKWKSRQPKLCVHCDRYFSNQFNLKQVCIMLFFREIKFTKFFVKLVSRKKCIRRGRVRVYLEGIGIFFEVKSANSLCYIVHVNSKTKINGLKKNWGK